MIGTTCDLIERPVREFVRGFAPDATPAEQEQLVEAIVGRQVKLAARRRLPSDDGWGQHIARKHARLVLEQRDDITSGQLAAWFDIPRRTAVRLKKWAKRGQPVSGSRAAGGD